VVRLDFNCRSFAQDASLLFFPGTPETFKVGAGCTCGVSLIDQPHLRQQKIGVCKLHGGQVLIHLRYIPTSAHTHNLQFHFVIFFAPYRKPKKRGTGNNCSNQISVLAILHNILFTFDAVKYFGI
jgi:hypothetical protein